MDQPECDYTAWIRRLQAHDIDAWEELFNQFSHIIWRTICRVGGFRPGEEDQVEDIRQETFSAAIQSIHKFRGGANIGTWLHRLAVNKTIDHIRKRQRSPLTGRADPTDVLTDSVEAALPPSNSTPADELVQKELYAQLQQCLEILRARNERWWSIVVMHHFSDLAYKEIAETLGMPLGTVQAALHRARLALADCLDGNKTGGFDDQ